MDILREAGFPVWFVIALGSYALVQAVRFRLGTVRAAELIGAGCATLLVGALATALAAQMAFGGMDHLPEADQRWVAWLGVKEALYNFDFACGFGTLAALVATVGRRPSAVASDS